MAGEKKRLKSSPSSAVETTQPQNELPVKASTVVADSNLGYKIRVLLHDFRTISTNPGAQGRISLTLDPLYIGAPYFTPEEATRVKGAIVDTYTEFNEYIDGPYFAQNSEHKVDHEEKAVVESQPQTQTIEEMLQAHFAAFLEKRKASGDARPYGPLDMAPLYQSVFGISGIDLQEKNFLRRLRKSGLQTDQGQNKSTSKFPDVANASGKRKRGSE
ncbi:putative C6 transcription factor [Annulohypoxylon bovei var. microspora]|nr:putative C6 transcription factor [Annulohypoxylon bovei var. microspora]